MIDHCVSELNARTRNDAFRSYIAEAVRIVAKGVGYEISYKYDEFIKAIEKNNEEDEKRPEDVISNIKSKIEALK